MLRQQAEQCRCSKLACLPAWIFWQGRGMAATCSCQAACLQCTEIGLPVCVQPAGGAGGGGDVPGNDHLPRGFHRCIPQVCSCVSCCTVLPVLLETSGCGCGLTIVRKDVTASLRCGGAVVCSSSMVLSIACGALWPARPLFTATRLNQSPDPPPPPPPLPAACSSSCPLSRSSTGWSKTESTSSKPPPTSPACNTSASLPSPSCFWCARVGCLLCAAAPCLCCRPFLLHPRICGHAAGAPLPPLRCLWWAVVGRAGQGLQHLRVIALTLILLTGPCSPACLPPNPSEQAIDVAFLQYSLGRTMAKVRRSQAVGVDLLFAFEYTVQASTIVLTFVKYCM